MFQSNTQLQSACSPPSPNLTAEWYISTLRWAQRVYSQQNLHPWLLQKTNPTFYIYIYITEGLKEMNRLSQIWIILAFSYLVGYFIKSCWSYLPPELNKAASMYFSGDKNVCITCLGCVGYLLHFIFALLDLNSYSTFAVHCIGSLSGIKVLKLLKTSTDWKRGHAPSLEIVT